MHVIDRTVVSSCITWRQDGELASDGRFIDCFEECCVFVEEIPSPVFLRLFEVGVRFREDDVDVNYVSDALLEDISHTKSVMATCDHSDGIPGFDFGQLPDGVRFPSG